MDLLAYYLKKLDEKQTLIGRTDSKGSAVLIIVSFISSASMVVLFKLNVAWQQYLFSSLYCAALLCILFLDIFKVILPRFKHGTISKDHFKEFSTEDMLDSTYKELENMEKILTQKNKYLAIVFVLLIIMTLTLVASTICAIY